MFVFVDVDITMVLNYTYCYIYNNGGVTPFTTKGLTSFQLYAIDMYYTCLFRSFFVRGVAVADGKKDAAIALF